MINPDALLANHNLDHIKDRLVDLQLPCISLWTEPATDSTPKSGTSRVGGQPDLPHDFPWPTWQGTPLTFLCQLNLAEMHAAIGRAPRLPREGTLAFFYALDHHPHGLSPHHEHTAHVAYLPPRTRTTKRAPGYHPDTPDPLPICTIQYQLNGTIPPPDSPFLFPLQLSRQERERYAVFYADLHHQNAPYPDHRLLGHSAPIAEDLLTTVIAASAGIDCEQGRPEDDPELIHALAHEPGWVHLLQLDTDEEAGLLLDGSRLNIWCDAPSLTAATYARVWATLPPV